MATIFTLGYGNRPPADTLRLIPEGVQVIDVRYKPTAWSPLLTATALRQHFGEQYASIPALGNPSMNPDQWVPEDTGKASLFLMTIAKRLDLGKDVLLLCAEIDPLQCHRRFVAEALRDRVPGATIVHLGVKGTAVL
jgi:uncharacterized protein (DUF488 family)